MNNQQIPEYVAKYFWGDDLTELDLKKNERYILQVILERGDQQAVQWILQTIGKDEVKKLLPTIKLSKKSANFWQIYLS